MNVSRVIVTLRGCKTGSEVIWFVINFVDLLPVGSSDPTRSRMVINRSSSTPDNDSSHRTTITASIHRKAEYFIINPSQWHHPIQTSLRRFFRSILSTGIVSHNSCSRCQFFSLRFLIAIESITFIHSISSNSKQNFNPS